MKIKEVIYSFGWRSVVISWSADIGWGELALIFTDNGLEIDKEGLNNASCIAVISEAIKRIDEGQKASKLEMDTFKFITDDSADIKFMKSIMGSFLFYLKSNSL